MVSAVDLLVKSILFDVMWAAPRNELWLQHAASVQTRLNARATSQIKAKHGEKCGCEGSSRKLC